MSRLYCDKGGIDSEEVKIFFADRPNRDLSIVLFQDKENSEQRQLEEKKLFHKHIEVSGKKVLEVRCGIGRWTEALHDKCESFLGIDYSVIYRTEDEYMELFKYLNHNKVFPDNLFEDLSNQLKPITNTS